MLAWSRPERRLRVAAAVFALGVAAGVAADGFRIAGVQPRLAGSQLLIEGSIELDFTAPVEEALGNGIPLEVVIDVRLYRRRTLVWDALVESWALRRQIRYHALSGQYLVSGEPAIAAQRESFNSLPEALAEAGTLEDIGLRLDQAPPEGDYRLGLRATLDIEALPPLLRPVAYTSRAWDLNTGWTTWKVQR